MSKTNLAAAKIKRWRHDPVAFVVENFGVSLDGWQIEALRSVAGFGNPRRKLVMKSATGCGKSALLAWLVWFRLSCYGEKGEAPKGACLSGEGFSNLADNLWAECAKFQKRSEFLSRFFTWNKQQITANGQESDWFCSARSFPRDGSVDQIGQSLSGLHGQYPFVILDEVGNAPPILGSRAAQIFTGNPKDALVAMAGNPVSQSGLLYAECVDAKNSTVISVTGDPDDKARSSRIDIDHAREMIRKFGRDNSWVKSSLLGIFPDTAINSLLSLEDVEKAMKRDYNEEEYKYSQKRLGCDCARFGTDATMLAPRQGLVAHLPVEMRGARSNEIAARIMLAKQNWNFEIVFVDATGGWSSGVADQLIQAGESPQEINFAGRSPDNKYRNMRAFMWFMMASWIKRGGKLPNKPELIRQFATPEYTFSNGKFVLEEKDLIKKRLGFSPDYADALALTFAMPEMPANIDNLPRWLVANRLADQTDGWDWDPLTYEE